MEMLQPDSVFTFGKYKGKTVLQVFDIQPSYLCWMRKTGFSDFGKEVTEAIFAWEEQNPKEVKSIERRIAAAGTAEINKAKKEELKVAIEHSSISAQHIKAAQADPLFGSW